MGVPDDLEKAGPVFRRNITTIDGSPIQDGLSKAAFTSLACSTVMLAIVPDIFTPKRKCFITPAVDHRHAYTRRRATELLRRRWVDRAAMMRAVQGHLSADTAYFGFWIRKCSDGLADLSFDMFV